jgi:hypothetical protein
MSQLTTSPRPGVRGAGRRSPQADKSGLQGRRLVLVRIGWGIAALCGIGSFLAQLPGHYADLHQVCVGPVCAYGQLSPAAAQSFALLGISVGTYAILRTGLTAIVALIWFVSAIVLAWRKADDWLSLLIALWFICAGTATITGAFGLGTASTTQGHELYARTVNLLAEFGVILLVFALFPTQRFAPRAAFWLLIGIGYFLAGPSPADSALTLPLRLSVLIALLVAQIYHLWRVSGSVQPHKSQWMTIGLTVFIGLTLIFLAISSVDRSLTVLVVASFYGALTGTYALQLARYWQVSSTLGRQQTKWIAFGIATFVMMAAILLAPVLVVPSLGTSGAFYQSIHTVILIAASLLLPVTIIIAILRYHLWDIDRLINRTLVYGSLTGLLGILYGGLLIGLGSLTELVTRQVSRPVVLVVSTLAIFALVQPLRNRLQNMVDRRFYRRKYDAEKTLTAFSATLRSEIDLEQLRRQLLHVVEETMQPAHFSLWLRPPDRRAPSRPR